MSLRAARRVALLSQGFGRTRPATVGPPHLLATARRTAITQIDSVNVLARSQYLPFLARLGPYDTALLDGLRDGRGPSGRRTRHRLVEYWAHEASLVPVEDWPLYGFRMRRAHSDAWGGMRAVAREHPGLVQQVREVVAQRGPLPATGVEAVLEHREEVGREHWGWNWSLVKAACEHLFWSGELTSAGRGPAFERRFALPEAVLPPEVVAAGPLGEQPLDEDEAFTRLVSRAARAHGIGTLRCLRDYARLSVAQAGPAVERLLATGELQEVEVPGWSTPSAPVYLHRDAPRPRPVGACALLSPFDPVVWQRERAEALWGLRYRIEIYTPAPQRVHGYYVLPFLLGDDLVARVDLKADRAAGVLRAPTVHTEPRWDPAMAPELDVALAEMAAWLGLVQVDRAEPAPNPVA
ncbi:winged helix-turn-helix domain-containing protein [Kytococcus sp. HMSC28H12]|uniref:winged helix-turn-helix domain-containing protein n=1 Tax=Kytococcus sp. HMSC28H12 TaxID=1581067 RepID=UPI00114C8617|nr:crosslink repair DNA glycosylase YcaQ family protein [Kytococcus sp. HMSC28H12]